MKMSKEMERKKRAIKKENLLEILNELKQLIEDSKKIKEAKNTLQNITIKLSEIYRKDIYINEVDKVKILDLLSELKEYKERYKETIEKEKFFKILQKHIEMTKKDQVFATHRTLEGFEIILKRV